MSTYIKNRQILSRLMRYLKLLEKEANSKISRWKKIIKFRAEINETKSWTFKKINKIDKPLTNLMKRSINTCKLIKIEMKRVHHNKSDKIQKNM
jgi:hypothetical protein